MFQFPIHWMTLGHLPNLPHKIVVKIKVSVCVQGKRREWTVRKGGQNNRPSPGS